MSITFRKILPSESGSRNVCGIAAAATLFLCGCASTIDTSGQAASSDSPEGYGTAIGSILLSIPTNIAGGRDQEIVQSLTSKKYEAIIGRFVLHEYGFASRTEHPGDKYSVSFAAGVAKHFIIRAPAGSYSFQKISQILTGPFGKYGGCRIEGIANFDIHPGRTTYIGELSIIAEFKHDQRWVQGQMNLGMIPRTLPEAALGMRGSVTDKKAESLRAIARDEASQAIEIDTSLMFVDERDKWDCVQPPPPAPPPGVPQKP